MEEKGIRQLLITTSGLSDLSVYGKQQHNRLLTISKRKTHPHFDKVIEVNESIDDQGNVITELSESKINNLLREVFNYKPTLVAIALLNSHKNPLHEKTIFNLLNAAGIKNAHVSYY